MLNTVQVVIKPDNFRHNLKLLRAKHPNPMPVIKADAYGHGLVSVARILVEEEVQQLAVGAVREGALLRQQLDSLDPNTLILAMMGLIAPEDAALAATYNITPIIHDLASLQRMAATAKALCTRPAPIALKFDTGMLRLGFNQADIPALLDHLRTLPELAPKLITTHLSSSDYAEKDDLTLKQYHEFSSIIQHMRQSFPTIKSSLLNSPGILAWNHLNDDISRPGICLYGGNPFYNTPRANLGAGLRSTMEVFTPIVSIHSLAKGVGIGYGATFIAPQDMQIAVIGIGYADGYFRSASNRGQVLINNQRAPIIGRVCMQMLMVDITALTNIKIGQPAYLLGGSGDKAISPDELASWCNTISYEVLCSLGKNQHVCSNILAAQAVTGALPII